MTAFQPQLWVDRAAAAVAFYQEAFGATVLHQVGEGDDIVAQLAPLTTAHGWHLARIQDPFHHEWELGKPAGDWPPVS